MKPTVNGRVLNLKALCLYTALLLPANFQLSVSELTEAKILESVEIPEINHEARVLHARELLGARTAELAGVKASGIPETMAVFIENYVTKALRESDKVHADAITQAILRESARHQMDPLFVMAIISQESRFNTSSVGGHGEIGLMQIKPSTAEWIAKKFNVEWTGAESLYDPATNIRLATAYFSYLRTKFEAVAPLYVAAYNMGPVAVKRKLASNIMPGVYAGGVMGKYRGLYRKLAVKIADSRVIDVSMTAGQNGQVLGRISN